jgi:hypothetical protein
VGRVSIYTSGATINTTTPVTLTVQTVNASFGDTLACR